MSQNYSKKKNKNSESYWVTESWAAEHPGEPNAELKVQPQPLLPASD